MGGERAGYFQAGLVGYDVFRDMIMVGSEATIDPIRHALIKKIKALRLNPFRDLSRIMSLRKNKK